MAIALFSQRAVGGVTVAAASQVVAITGGVTGSLLIALITIGSQAGTLNSITDNGVGGSSWQIDQAVAGTSTLNGYAFASKLIGATAPTSLTLNFSASVKFTWRILEFSGLASSAWFDKAATTKQTATGTTTPVTNAAVPVAAGELAVCVYGAGAAETSAGYSISTSGYTPLTPLNQAPDCPAGYNPNCAAGSQTAQATWGTSTGYGAGLAFYFAAPVPKAIPPQDKRRRLMAR